MSFLDGSMMSGQDVSARGERVSDCIVPASRMEKSLLAGG